MTYLFNKHSNLFRHTINLFTPFYGKSVMTIISKFSNNNNIISYKYLIKEENHLLNVFLTKAIKDYPGDM